MYAKAFIIVNSCVENLDDSFCQEFSSTPELVLNDLTTLE